MIEVYVTVLAVLVFGDAALDLVEIRRLKARVSELEGNDDD